jgi:hypothetical protein
MRKIRPRTTSLYSALIHVVSEVIRRLPELGLEAEVRPVSARVRVALANIAPRRMR